eukprot:TRINITY_DN13394_c0_g1_i1.p1 TRINITY_DN13394_c0_g1~~TRINITY_DN13394_c0_g1_i1.p1  ORF type:complete len:152 (+),score=58.27 TRINITY_DN13394_c0_g1_i1:43-456(+)
MTQKQLEEFQRKLNIEVGEMKELQKQASQLINSRTQMAGQQSENEMVKQELELMKEGDQVYKLIGPALVAQDKEDATAIVDKRLQYINSELARIEKQIKETDDKQEQRRQKIMEIQQQAQAAVQKLQQQQKQQMQQA